MAFSINQVFLVGNITQAPELRFTPNGNPVLSFSMATNQSVKDGNGGFKDIPTFHNIVVWGKLGNWLSENIAKGERIAVRGRINNRSWEKNGVKQYRTEIVADDVIPMSKQGGNRSSGANQNQGHQEGTENVDFNEFVDDDKNFQNGNDQSGNENQNLSEGGQPLPW